jgi:hypothetical protein
LKYKTYKKILLATSIRNREVIFPSQPLLVLMCKEERVGEKERLFLPLAKVLLFRLFY